MKMNLIRRACWLPLYLIALLSSAAASGTVCVELPNPAYNAEVIGLVQYTEGVEAIVHIIPPDPDVNSIAVIDARSVQIPIDLPAFSITSVRTVNQRDSIGSYLRQDVGLWVLYDADNPSGGRAFDYQTLGGNGWIDSPIIGWVSIDSSGWNYSESLGWIWATSPEVVQNPTNPSECAGRGVWIWRSQTEEWAYLVEGSSEWIYTAAGGWMLR